MIGGAAEVTEWENLHAPVYSRDRDGDDVRVCGTCGVDLRNLFMCPDAPTAECGCPLYLGAGEHEPHE